VGGIFSRPFFYEEDDMTQAEKAVIDAAVEEVLAMRCLNRNQMTGKGAVCDAQWHKAYRIYKVAVSRLLRERKGARKP
jgi:hypothetical protein